MTSVALAICAALGMLLVLTSQRLSIPGESGTRTLNQRLRGLNGQASGVLVRSGLIGVSPLQFLAASLIVGVLAAGVSGAIFGFGLSSVLVGFCAAATPAALWRQRRLVAQRVAQESWPRFIEELRVLTGAAGRPIPQALLDVGSRGPEELRGAFAAGQREWALTTDFERTVAVLKSNLADPTADAVLETLLVAVQVGGNLDPILAELAEDRRQDLLGRKEAQAKQSGARFARAFVVLVPVGMAAAGLSVGDGATAYRSTSGQLLVSIGVGLVVVCWIWSGRIMRLPEQRRVFD